MDTKGFKDRSTLRSYFLKNKIPTEANFADLINSTLNKIEDGVFKPAGDPLSIIATGDAASPQKLINFYGGLSDANPSWTLQMRPRSDQNDPATARAGFSVSDGQGNSRLFVDGAAGNVGIGTVAPDRKLTLATVTGANYMNIKDGTREILMGVDGNGGIVSVMSNHDLLFRAGANNEKMRITSSGAVGIGTTSPAGLLDVANLVRFGFDENGSGSKSISFTRDAGDEGNAGKITYKGGFGSALNIVGAGATPRKIKLWDNVEVAGNLTINGQINRLDVLENFTAVVRCGDFRIGTNQRHNGNPWTGRALVDTADTLHINYGPDWPNVQINGKVFAPSLSVAGSIAGGETATGWVLGRGAWGPDNWLRLTTHQNGSSYHDLAINSLWSAGTKRFDLAEITPVNEDDRLEQGDVVVIDASFGLRVTRSRKPGDTAVYGVVSSYEQAAMVIGGVGGPEAARNDPGNLPIALVGRVAVKVSAENGPIAAGDLLTTAATPGHAMRCDDRVKYAGAIVGKALEPLADGVGVIKMLVAMQ